MSEFKTSRLIREDKDKGIARWVRVVNKSEAVKMVNYWKNAAICEKPRGSCRTCPTTNCYFKGRVA